MGAHQDSVYTDSSSPLKRRSSSKMPLTEVATPKVGQPEKAYNDHTSTTSVLRSISSSPSPHKRNEPPLVLNILYTQYEIIHDVAAKCNFKTSTDEDDDWDIWFIDGPTMPSLLQKMKPYQRTNHFPGMYVMARKNLLAKNLLGMQKYFAPDFQFFPKTWLLPGDLKSFKD